MTFNLGTVLPFESRISESHILYLVMSLQCILYRTDPDFFSKGQLVLGFECQIVFVATIDIVV